MSDSGVPQRHVFTHPSRVEHWRHVSEIVALVVAATWAFYVFVYQERIKPANEAPNLEVVNPIVEHQDVHGGKQIVTIMLPLKNAGTPALQLDGFIIDVSGIRYGDRVVRQPASDVVAFDATLPKIVRAPLYSFGVMYAPFGSHERHAFLGPGIVRDFGFSFALPQSSYDAVSVEYSICYQRADDERVVRYTPRRSSNGMLDTRAMIAFFEHYRHVYCGWLPPLRDEAL
jgi:hypothetical protein